MTPVELTDIVAEFTPTLLGSFVAPLAIFGLGAVVYHLSERYELFDKSKAVYSQTKGNLIELLKKYHS
ncbi:hypothetical protein HOE37_05805 [Candidatus Woesearchaeota archaeon]|jgi:hypothetical protein|nr:hypothetical protein [Candidatus Woesearchaeota archaeon]MBT4111348.1 hypothetical protein [Candidatus Woesearchaeota archaeon]MBT4336473.1 hypothetical protein [Candidatus Woesearchaeota archaeon]MBT4469886.1 hypothetical protein [Candidatus Woesearchaeota archaeon]MBT6744443.1 hypothetical protein [Candidatus Woesearchaeota archaeon]